MKKFLFIILSLMLTVFIVTGCSEDADNNSSNNGDDNTDMYQGYVGTYTVELFATLSPSPFGGGNIFMTTNCDEAVNRGWAVKDTTRSTNEELPACTNEGNVKMIGGKVTFEKNGEGSFVIKSKMQLYHKIMNLSPNDTYQYVEYAPVPVANITEKTINKGENSVKGVSGRNLTAKTNNPESTFFFEVNEDGTIFNNLLLVGKKVMDKLVDPRTYVILKKEKNEVDVLDPNSLFKETTGDTDADAVFETFVKNVE